MLFEMLTPIDSAVSASPRFAWVIQTTYDCFSKLWPSKVTSCFSSCTSIPLKTSHSTSRFASASLRWFWPSPITYAFGYSYIQLLFVVERRRAARRARRVGDAAAVELELVLRAGRAGSRCRTGASTS